jgi:large subunit ribosomal protein L28
MPRECAICGKRVQVGNQYTYRGLAKYKGGVGRKVTGKTKRKFRPNLQRVRASVGGSTSRVRVCTRCLKSGKVVKPLHRNIYETAAKVGSSAAAKAGAKSGTSSPAEET